MGDRRSPARSVSARRLFGHVARAPMRLLLAAVVAAVLIGALLAGWPSPAGEQAPDGDHRAQPAAAAGSQEIVKLAGVTPGRTASTSAMRPDRCVLPCQWKAGCPQPASSDPGKRPPPDWPSAGDGVNTLFGQGSYVEPGRMQHIGEYRLRVDDVLDVIFRRTRAEQPKPYELQVGDRVRVELRREPEVTRDLEIQPDGTIALPLLGTVRATRRSVEQLRQDLEKAFVKAGYREPAVTVTPLQRNIRLQDLLDTVDRRYGTGGLVQEVRVTPDGSIGLTAVGSVHVQGLTLDELKRELDYRFGLIVEGLDVQPVLRARAPRFVFVLGEVQTPGRYTLEGPTTIMQGIALAGGITTAAAGKLCNIVVFRRGPDWRMMATRLNVRGPLLTAYESARSHPARDSAFHRGDASSPRQGDAHVRFGPGARRGGDSLDASPVFFRGPLFVHVGRESVSLDPTATTGQTLSMNDSRESEMTSIVDLLANRVLRERVADALGAEAIWPSVDGTDYQLGRAEAIGRLDSWLAVSSSKNSGVESVQYRVPSPALAQQIVKTFVEEFCGLHLCVHRVEGSQEFFAAQQALLRSRFDETAEALRQAKSGWI